MQCHLQLAKVQQEHILVNYQNRNKDQWKAPAEVINFLPEEKILQVEHILIDHDHLQEEIDN